MPLPHPGILGAFYALSEIVLSITHRSGSNFESRDRHSLAILWSVICAAIMGGLGAAQLYPGAALPHRHIFYLIGLVLFAGGILLRWYSILHLGRFFTVNVSIASQHKLIDSGPYRFIRHPSYTGALLAFIGFGLCLGNWLSLLLVILPIFGAFLRRIHVEECALTEALGEEYHAYIGRTWRLIPFLY